MSAKAVEVVILCEDLQQEVFVRRFLMEQGRDRWQFRPLIAPVGASSAEQWVREQLPNQLKAHRTQSSRRRTLLVVATDADKMTVADRMKSFEAECKRHSVTFRQEAERIAFAIPRRNIETWCAYLRGEDVDETKEYPKYDSESLCQPQVERLDEMCRKQQLEGTPPASLEFACAEFNRIKD